MSKNEKSAKQRLLDAAASLFYNYGISATGIDTITAKAGVAKKSLYNNFASKADLIAHYLEVRHAEWLELYRIRLNQSTSPKESVIAIFLAYQDHAEHAYESGFRGCGLLNAAAELPANSSGRRVVKEHKEEVEALLAKHIAEYLDNDLVKAEPLAKHLSFILEGAMARAGLEGNSQCICQAQQIAISLLDSL